jgi:hypothetical protein
VLDLSSETQWAWLRDGHRPGQQQE